MPGREWLPNPPDGISVCGGFDGSENEDWTAIKLETREGLIFTPRYGPEGNRKAAIWNPSEWDGRIPRDQVHAAWSEIARRYRLVRVYCDPGFRDEMSWETEIETWDREHGPKVFIPWQMAGSGRITNVYQAMRRFESDLAAGLIKQDGCPITQVHMDNARKIAQTGDRYGIGKPSKSQKIDAAVTTLLAHEAACDARADGWVDIDTTIWSFN